MSNFKRKVNIVESATPPTNSYDWWYDLNTNTLKRHKGVEWDTVSSSGSKNFNHDNQFYYTSTDGSDITLSDTVLFNSKPILITKPSNIITENLFYSAGKLKTLYIPEGINIIAVETFYNCPNLESVILPNSLKEIQTRAFTTSLRVLYVGDNITSIEPSALPATSTYKIPSIRTKDGKYLDQLIVNDCLVYTTSMEASPYESENEIVISNEVTRLGSKSLATLKGVEGDEQYDEESGEMYTEWIGWKIFIPDSVTDIADDAFAFSSNGISNLTGKYTVDGKCVVKDGQFFIYADGAQQSDFVVPEGITSIAPRAFQGSQFLETLTLPSSLLEIKAFAFVRMEALTKLFCKSINPPVLEDSSVFDNNSCEIYVPQESVQAYKTATNWSKLASRIKGYDF